VRFCAALGGIADHQSVGTSGKDYLARRHFALLMLFFTVSCLVFMIVEVLDLMLAFRLPAKPL